MTDKPAFRTMLRAARADFVAGLDAMTAAALQQQLADQLVPHLPPSGAIAVYAPYGAEIDPVAIVERLHRLGRTLLWPRVEMASGTLTFHPCAPDALVPGFRGLREPPVDAPAMRPDVVLLPLVGADLAGHRIGQGGGHYDRTLAALRSSGAPVLTIGLAWEVQLVAAVPADRWDQQLDALATPAHWIAFARH